MKKLIGIAFVLTAALLLLSGCGEGFDPQGHPLVGSWRSDGTSFTIYNFNDDGTGNRGTVTFTWAVLRYGNLRLTYDDPDRENETRRLNIMESGRMSMRPMGVRTGGIFVPIVRPEHLQGTWVWDEDPTYTLIMDADGRGNRGFGDDRENFRWLVDVEDPTRLVFIIGLQYEPWSYLLVDDVLTITTRIRNLHTQWSYIRVED